MSSCKQFFCDELNNTLVFFHDRIMSCCSGQIGSVYIEGYKGEKINWKDFIKIKNEAFTLLNENDIKNSPCNGCFFLRNKNSDDVILKKYNTLSISHWTHCNCGCIYCSRIYSSQGKITLKPQKSEYYDMLPIVKELYKEDLLDKENLKICIQGGDISVLEEFEDLIKEFIKNGFAHIDILSNNIKYQPLVKKLLEMNKASFITSLDCADRKTYYKLKRVDKFQDTVNNLKKYAENGNGKDITVRYIVIENVNDSVKMISNFIDLVSEIGIGTVDFMIDNKYSLFSDLDKTPLPKHYKNLYFVIKKLCEEKNINLFLLPQMKNIVNKYFTE